MSAQLLNAVAAQAAQQQPAIAVAAPMNDLQLVALVAAQLDDLSQNWSAYDRVTQAVDIVAHAVVAVQGGLLQGRVKQLVQEFRERN